MKTIGDYYKEIEAVNQTVHNIGIIVKDFPKGSFVYETMKTATEQLKAYKKSLLEIEID